MWHLKDWAGLLTLDDIDTLIRVDPHIRQILVEYYQARGQPMHWA